MKSPVVSSQDYYPFGLTFNSYQRENTVPNKLNLFQGQEHVDDLGLNWDSFKWRNHQPDIGRFFNVDPLAEKYVYNSPYAFSENKVVAHRELEGLESIRFDEPTIKYKGSGKLSVSVNVSEEESGITTNAEAVISKGGLSLNFSNGEGEDGKANFNPNNMKINPPAPNLFRDLTKSPSTSKPTSAATKILANNLKVIAAVAKFSATMQKMATTKPNISFKEAAKKEEAKASQKQQEAVKPADAKIKTNNQ